MDAGAAAAIGGGAESLFQAPGGKLGKQEFLQLLVAQLKNQDPMNPMESQEFASQLAQFSSVEQLVEVNEKLAGQGEYTVALAQAMSSNSAVGVLGHQVLAEGDALELAGGTGTIDVDVGGIGGVATVRVYDADDRQVGELDLGTIGGGRQTLAVAGLEGLPDGAYRYEIEVTSPAGDPVETTSYVTGTVTGVKYGMEGPVLMIGGMMIPMSAVVEVSATDNREAVLP